MNMMSTEAMGRQPANFDGLQTSEMKVEGVILHRTFKCSCGNEHLYVFAGPWSEGVAWLDPIKVECSACLAEREIFNSQTDGYDGKLCGGASCMQNANSEIVKCPNCDGRELQLKASIFYNIDFYHPQELAELNEEQKTKLSDLYDALGLSGTCKACGNEVQIGDWELA